MAQHKSPYYAGEIVWYQIGFSNWNVGVVISYVQSHSTFQYKIQPFQQSHIFLKEEALRPWRFLSPSTLIAQDGQNWGFKEAVAINNSYQLFNMLPTYTADEKHYAGAFLGAEKIWKGGPITIRRPNEETLVMVVHRFIVKCSQAASYNGVVGALYKIVEKNAPNNYNTRSNPLGPSESLLDSMRSEIDYRGKLTFLDKNGKRVWHQWKMLEAQVEIPLNNVQGRWYGTNMLLTIAAQSTGSHEPGQYVHDTSQLLSQWKCQDVESIEVDSALAWLPYARISYDSIKCDNLFLDTY